MKRQFLLTGALAIAVVSVGRAGAPHIYAITGARLVTAAGDTIEAGTVVIRNGLIDAVGKIAAPPDAQAIDGNGLVVYPGLIDMGTAAGVDVALPAKPDNAKTREELERWRRSMILRPQVQSALHVKPDSPELSKLAAAGITSALVVPPGEIVRGQSALVNTVAPEDEPQVGALADERRGLIVVRTPVALHVAIPERIESDVYPDSLMGVIAFVRQSFLDAQHYQQVQAHYERVTRGVPRPAYDPALEAMQPAIGRRMPVAFQAGSAREIRRALALARELKLDPIITGASEADQASADLKTDNARVLFSLDYPVRSKSLAPDADEPLRVLRQRSKVPKVPAALDKAGIAFAFESAGLKDPKDFVRNAAKAVKAGLAPDAAIRALTINAATLAGAGERLGSIEKGKIANLIVTDGDLFEEKTTIKHVFVDGRLVKIEPPREDKKAGDR